MAARRAAAFGQPARRAVQRQPHDAARAVRVLAAEGRVTVVRNWGAFVAER